MTNPLYGPLNSNSKAPKTETPARPFLETGTFEEFQKDKLYGPGAIVLFEKNYYRAKTVIACDSPTVDYTFMDSPWELLKFESTLSC